jgi:predicted metal-dependent hydrolase
VGLKIVMRQQRAIDLLGTRVDYLLNRKLGRRGAGLKIDPDHGLVVNAGVSMPIGEIESFLQSHAAWIIAKLALRDAKRVAVPQFVSGEKLPYLGGEIELQIVPVIGSRRQAFAFTSEALMVTPPPPGTRMAERVTRAYTAAAKAFFTERTQSLCIQHGVLPPKVLTTSAKSRWGSCNSRREMRLNWRLIKARVELIDYVICHELGHLKHMNHSPAFWTEVARMCPDWQRLRRELNDNDYQLRAF